MQLGKKVMACQFTFYLFSDGHYKKKLKLTDYKTLLLLYTAEDFSKLQKSTKNLKNFCAFCNFDLKLSYMGNPHFWGNSPSPLKKVEKIVSPP